MKSETFKNRVEKLIGKIETIIDKMPDKGDTCETSQKICLRQAINDFSYTVNGVTEKDFHKEEE